MKQNINFKAIETIAWKSTKGREQKSDKVLIV